MPETNFGSTDEDELNVSRKLSLYKHRKKQAANDAQLLMNRIALLQKEEDRSSRKIEQTKDRAMEILALRDENEKRLQALIDSNDSKKKFQRQLHQRNVTLEQESRKIRAEQAHEVYKRKKEDVCEVREEKNLMRQEFLRLQRLEYEKKQQRRAMVRKQEEEARLKREQDKRDQEKRVLNYFSTKAEQEEAEAKRAEKLVRELERKEREMIQRLRGVQETQESAFIELESALQAESMDSFNIKSPLSGALSGRMSSTASSARRARSTPRVR